MTSTRRRPATIASALATATRDIRRAVHAADPACAPDLVTLRDAGWQLTQLPSVLSDLVTLVAEHTGHHTEHADQVRRVDGEPAADQLARACRDLAALRRALDTAHTAARGYYTAVSHLAPAHTPPRLTPEQPHEQRPEF
ncbi:hypothetical protein [Saccharopolyspora phatthalungensis]|uniref:PE domain-containing protein n=1 Tax=Saccharopolyspora phatthalungensis TaxID=664693 RepID=A0A840QFN8_9PSEU|nr:hypothetical protein [Saccharopolyspora phatthalungensis]MBB5157295.1 hypothetical protein [Saccharopolyspora phatthalungensis]